MTCRDIADEQVIELYVQGRLSLADAERFEDHYMECPRCQEALEQAAALDRGFKHYAAQQSTTASQQPASPVDRETVGRGTVTPLSSHRRRRRWQPLVGSLAALLALSAGIRWLIPASGAGPSGVTVAFLQAERATTDSTPSHQLEQPADDQGLVLVLELDPPFYPVYQATLEQQGRPLWSARGLEPGERDTVSLSLAAGLLAPGDYSLRLTASTADGRSVAVAQFGFRVVATQG